jgi:hypothetical protein
MNTGIKPVMADGLYVNFNVNRYVPELHQDDQFNWWFFDESDTYMFGPYNEKHKAEVDMVLYCYWLYKTASTLH